MKMVIFDCDGVLVDSETATNTVIARNLTRYGLPLTAGESQALFVGGTIQSAGDEARRRGASLPPDWVDEMYREIFARLREGVDTLPGIDSLLDQLDAERVATAIASNGPPEKMRISLGPSGLWERFAGRIYSGHTHPPPKPAPDMLLAAASDADIAPADCAMIDDSPTGLKAARAAGMHAIGFAAQGAPETLAPWCDDVVRSHAEIPALLGLTSSL